MNVFRKSPKAAKKGKEGRTWALGGTNKEFESLDYTKDKVSADSEMIFQQASYMPKAEVNEPDTVLLNISSKCYLYSTVSWNSERRIERYGG